jgi:Amt family ammonium transporter
LSRRKSALSLIWAVTASNAVCIFQWYFWGYSLAFSPSATNGFIGNLANFGLINVLDNPSPGSPLIPDLLYAFYQMEFACVTVGILMGGIAERGRVLPAMIFTFLWMTLVYCPLACWPWNIHGWGFKYGVLDYAGNSHFFICACPISKSDIILSFERWRPCGDRKRGRRFCLCLGAWSQTGKGTPEL